jgi:hypothetical protein
MAALSTIHDVTGKILVHALFLTIDITLVD